MLRGMKIGSVVLLPGKLEIYGFFKCKRKRDFWDVSHQKNILSYVGDKFVIINGIIVNY